jgi:hypothetical protein
MTDFYKYKIVRISSSDAVGSNDINTDFTVNINGIDHPAKNKCIGVRLEQLVMGAYFYNVKDDVIFSFEEKGNGTGRLNITIPAGHYSLGQLEDKIEADIQNYLTMGVTVTVEEDPVKRKLKISLSSGEGKVYADTTASASSILGFDETTQFSLISIAQSSPRLFGLEQMYVECRDLATNNLLDTKKNNARPVLKVIQTDAGYGEKINYVNNNSSDRIIWKKSRQLNKLTFRLTNGDGDVLVSQCKSDHVKIILNFLYI